MITRAREQYDESVKKRKPTEIRQGMDYDIEFEDSFSDSDTESLTEKIKNRRK